MGWIESTELNLVPLSALRVLELELAWFMSCEAAMELWVGILLEQISFFRSKRFLVCRVFSELREGFVCSFMVFLPELTFFFVLGVSPTPLSLECLYLLGYSGLPPWQGSFICFTVFCSSELEHVPVRYWEHTALEYLQTTRYFMHPFLRSISDSPLKPVQNSP